MFFTKKGFKGHSDRISSIAFSPDDRFAVSGGFAHQFFLDQSARIWEIPSGRKIRELKGHKCGVFSVAYSPDGRMIATGGGGIVRGRSWRYDNAIRTWDVQTGRQISQFGEDLFFVDTLAFSPDGKFLTSGSKNHAPRAPHKDGRCLRLWDWRSGRERCSLGSHVSAVTSVSFSPDGKYLASGSIGMRADGSMPGGRQVKMRMVNTNPGGAALPADAMGPQQLREFAERQDLPAQVREMLHVTAATLPEGRKVVLDIQAPPSIEGVEARTLRIFETESGQELTHLAAYHKWVNSVCFSADGSFLLSAGHELLLWRVSSGNPPQRFELEPPRAIINCAAIAENGLWLAVGTGYQNEPGAPYEDCFVTLLSINSGSAVARWPFKYPVHALAMSHHSRFILAGSEHGEIQLLECPSKK